ncbi:MAG: phosphoglucosamine mutase [Candidatus Methanomethylophilaceae archaeon]|nr:phosphoglucosamine mutase [Candidatus Methanomethylophilaceae archaeon]
MAERMFGTNGVRGVVNEYMTSDLALQMGKAIGTEIRGTVAIATDTRVSAEMIKSAVAAGIMASGYSVVDLGIVPTPALQYYVKTRDNIAGGVMITASHNPPQFNGIKCVSEDGTEMSRTEEAKIEELYAQEIKCVPWNKVGSITRYGGAGAEYVDAVLSHVDVPAIRAAGLTVCFDAANGASYETTPLMLKKLNVRAITINCDPQGEFPGHLSEPTEENLGDLMRMTRDTGSSIGIAHDGDADRCVFISSQGKYVSGDKSLAIMSKHMLSSKSGSVVTPVSSSTMVEEVVTAAGGRLVYTAVGSPVVARKMMDIGAVFGGEENGGLIFPEMQYCRDGAMTVAKMLECIVKNDTTLGLLAEDLPVYYTEKRKIECPDAIKKKLMDFMTGAETEAKIDSTDGLKFVYPDGWVLARPSGTEPVFRIYSESKDKSVAAKRADKFEALAREFLNPA